MTRTAFLVLVLASTALGQTGNVYHNVTIRDDYGELTPTTVEIYVPGTTTHATIYKDRSQTLPITQPITSSSTNTTLSGATLYWYGADGYDYKITTAYLTQDNAYSPSLNASHTYIDIHMTMALDSELYAFSRIDPNALDVPYWATTTTMSSTPMGATGRAILDDANSAEARSTISAQKQFMFDVTDVPYNASPGDATDDTAAIQAAENAADDTNGIMFFPPGRYRVTGTITFSSGVSVYGPGAEIVVPTADEFADPVLKWTNASDFTISGISVVGGQTQAGFAGAAGEDRAAIYLDTCSKFTIRDVNVSNKSIGIGLDTCSEGSITDSRFVGFCDPDSYVNGSGYNYSKAIWVGIDSGQSSDIAISGCYFEHWGDAVGGSISSPRVTITACHMDGFCDNAIYASSGADWAVQANYIKRSLGYGVKLRGSGYRVVANKIYNSGSVDLSMGGGGINITSLSTTDYDEGIVISDNVIDTTTSYGISVSRNTGSDPGLRGVVITGNDCNNCGDSTVADNFGMSINIGVGVSSVVCSNNNIRNSGESRLHGALAITGSVDLDSNDILIANNNFHTCQGGIYAQYTAGVTCVNNHFREIVDQAIRLYLSCDNWTLAFNDGNNVDAVGSIFIYADSGEFTNSKVVGNSAVGNWTTITNSACDSGNGNWIFGNDSSDLTTLNGSLAVANGSTSAGFVTFYEDSSDGSNYLKLQAQAMAGNVTLTWPADDGDAGEVLTTNGAGVLDWSSAGAGDMTKAVYDPGDDGVDGNDTAYSADWDGDVNAPTMNAVYDQMQLLGGDMTKAVYDPGDDGVDGNDAAYAAGWDGDVNAPTMNAIYDAGFLTVESDPAVGTHESTYDHTLIATALQAEVDPAVGTHESTYDHTLIATALQSETDPTALLTAGTDNVKDTHIDWGAGAGQVNADDLGDGATNAVPTLTQESNWDTAYGWGNHASAGYLTAEVDGSTTNEIEVVDEAFNATNFNGGTTSGVSQDDFYDLWHGIDTDDDGDIDAAGIDATVWATKQASDPNLTGIAAVNWANGNLIRSTGSGGFEAVTANAGTDITADLEEEVTEGSLADSTIVSADIKDGTIAGGDLATNIAITSTGAQDYGGAAGFEIPNGANPTVDAAGEIAQDTDGANETGDVSVRAYDGTNTFMVERKLKTFQATIIKPQDLADATRDCLPIWSNNTGMVFTVTEIMAWSDTDDTTVTVEIVTATDFSSPTTLDALEIATNSTSVYTCTETTISDATVAHDEIITLDFDDTDDPGWVKVSITGWFNAAVD